MNNAPLDTALKRADAVSDRTVCLRPGSSGAPVAPCLRPMGSCMREPTSDHWSAFPIGANTAICTVAPDAGNRHSIGEQGEESEK